LLLNEAISLEREPLYLNPSSHPDRVHSCRNLAASLHTHYNWFGNELLLHEAMTLFHESIQLRPPHHPQHWYALTALSRMHLNKQTLMYNVDLAIDYLSRVVTLNADSLPSLLSRVDFILSNISISNLTPHSLHKLLQCLVTTLDISSLVVGFILDHRSQLMYLRSCRAIGPSVYVCAALCNQQESGLTLLEQARAMMWSQLLHVRDPQFEGIPLDMASELQQLLCSVSGSKFVDTSTHPLVEEHASYLRPQDIRYRQNTRINQLLRQIRMLPGHEHFMRRLSFKHLAHTAVDHVVIVLIAVQETCYALILRSAEDTVEEIGLENITPDKLERLSVAMKTERMRGSTNDGLGVDRKMGSYRQQSLTQLLRNLWLAVVSPVLNHLHIKVSIVNHDGLTTGY
jgi:hypothetical protein